MIRVHIQSFPAIRACLVLFCLLWAGQISVRAQLGDYHLQLFDFNSGIKPGTINSMAKDQEGFLWILYSRSVQRYDGKDILTYRFPEGVTQVTCDATGRVWVSSSTAIFMFNSFRLAFDTVGIDTKMEKYSIGSIFSIPGDQTWAVTSHGFLEYDPQRKAFVDLDQSIPVAPNYHANSLCVHQSKLYFGRGDFVYRYDVLSNSVDSLPTKRLRRLFAVSADSILLSSWDLNTYWYDFGRKEVTLANIPDSLKSTPDSPWSLRSVAKLDKHHFIMASHEGLFFYHARLKSFQPIRLLYHGKSIFTSDFANHIIIDLDHYAWVATIDGIGRFSLLGQTFGLWRSRTFYDNMPSGIDNIRQMAEGENEILWIATGHGFIRWDMRTNQQKFYFPEFGSKNKLAFPSVRGIVYDGRYVILGPSDLGLWLFEPRTEQFRRPRYASQEVQASSEGDFIDYLFRMRNGNIIVPGRDRLYLLKANTYELSFLDLPFDRENNNFVFQTKDGMVWMTTLGGMYLLDEQLRLVSKVNVPDDDGYVIAGCPKVDGGLLFSTQTKVYDVDYKNGNLHVRPVTFLPETEGVNILIEDHHQMIWATTDNGLYRYDPATERLNKFDYTDNLQGFGFNGNSWVLSSRDVLFIGGTNGINYFIPEKIQALQEKLNLFIQQVRIGEDSTNISLTGKILIPWSQRSLECHFVCPYFNNPGKLQYRYKLEGLDLTWKYIGNNNIIRFSSLAAGSYKLILEASINNADWVPSQNSFSFEILPPLWMRWWFVMFVIAIMAMLVWWIIRARSRRLLEKVEELEAEQAIQYFSTRMAEHHTEDDLLWDVAKNCIGRLAFEDCVIYLLDEEQQVLVQKAAHGPKSPERFVIVNPITIRPGEGITGTVAATGKPELIKDTSMDPRYIVDGERRYSEITVPMIANGQVIGVIDCEHSKKAFFTQRHLSILTTIASLCAAKIIKIRAEAEKTATERILMETKQQMADIEMQALRAQMNPHFIFNCLNSINRYIVKSDQATASLYLTRFAKLIRLILDNSNSKTVTLSNELEALKLYIEMESIRFEKQFTYSIEVAPDVHPDHVYVPPLIIQPYVENAIWHGLLHKEEAGVLKVSVTRKSPMLLECVIEDNGVGRAKARELKSKSASAGKSLGMKLTESRLALLNKHADWNAAVEIIDLHHPDGTPAGTRVVLRVFVDA